jgi:hypothetical protein
MLQHISAAAVFILLCEQQTDCFSVVMEPVQSVEVSITFFFFKADFNVNAYGLTK